MDTSKKNKILIVEDHHDMLLVLQKYLEDQNFIVVQASTGEEGIEKFEAENPDLVLMDLMLPGISGLDVIKTIREKQPKDLFLPIIIITAKNDISDIVSGLGTGADDYIVKPFHFDELIARIDTALRMKELNEQLTHQSGTLEDANQKINALNNQLLEKNRELRKNIYGLHSLFEVSMDLSSILDLEGLVNSSLLTIIGQYSVKNALFMLSNKSKNNRLTVFSSRAFDHNTESLVLHPDDPLVTYFNKRPEPIIVDKLPETAAKTRIINQIKEFGISLIMPVMIENNVSGLIFLGPRLKQDGIEDRELQQLTILSNIISISLNNASLYKEVEQLSYTDGMTSLHNYRYFELRLKEEINRHARTKAGLSLLILDVDYFKNFNDTLGHQAGDEVLRLLGHILRETSRENDIVSRYGGEEFAIILPAVDKDGALVLAERIRKKIELTPFTDEHVQPGGRVTVSIGAASLGKEETNSEDLIKKADLALYAAKHAGRNKVKLFEEGMKENP